MIERLGSDCEARGDATPRRSVWSSCRPSARTVVHLWANLPEGEFADIDPCEPGGQGEGQAGKEV